jgi:hypothetical protein
MTATGNTRSKSMRPERFFATEQIPFDAGRLKRARDQYNKKFPRGRYAKSLGQLYRRPSLGKEPIQDEQQDRAHDGSDKACRFPFTVPTKAPAEESRHECSNNAEENGNNEATRIFPRHQELRNSPNDEADD